MFQIASRLRQVPEFKGVTDEMFVEVVSGGDAPTAIRGRQRILATLFAKQGAEKVARLIEARKVELRQEIKLNAPDSERKAHERAFNALFVKISEMELEALGFREWAEQRNDEGRVPEPKSNVWFVEAVAFLLGEKAVKPKEKAPPSTLSITDSMKLSRSSLLKVEGKPNTASSSRSSDSASRASNTPDSRKVSSILKVANANRNIAEKPSSDKSTTRANTSLVSELEAELREVRRECALLREEVAKMEDIVA
ncbi:hypothetical protein HDU99_000910, partial [Rhizoclosmatium hyalinum]